ncbi:glycoside hydrolase family 2 protein [Streptomyces sp. NPDC093261]|uniref:glycoside hydrolase family 2 protein n=1 Tax=Streptomyces sp. NPDC093261 TaxID=3366037 RepID=UPI0037FEC844
MQSGGSPSEHGPGARDAGGPTAAAPAAPPRPQYPRPQFVRRDWLCLNGTWQFEIDQADTGLERGLLHRELASAITVPFAPEAPLSGIGCQDFLEAVWYRRTLRIPHEWAGQRILLHFQAVDHDTTVWIDGHEVGRHRGGFSGFTLDITEFAAPGSAPDLVVRARDSRAGVQARGKQSTRYDTYEAFYPRTTGIWQTVWLEPVPRVHLLRPRITPDTAGGRFLLDLPVSANAPGHHCRAVLADDDGTITEATAPLDADRTAHLVLDIPAERRRLWQPGDPHLYTLTLDIRTSEGELVDSVASYAGLRSVTIDGHAVLLNGRRVFQRLVLDQGWYPDGLMTAPDDESLVRDIEISMAAGFNGARLHQKVFEERFLHHADRLGYLVWGEFGDWGARAGARPERQAPTASFITQWLEALERDYSHPSIIGWCPLNETFQEITDHLTVLDDVTRGMFLATKAADRTRPVIDSSGYSHRVPETDVYDSHNYEQDPERFAQDMAGLADGKPFVNAAPDGSAWSLPYAGQPYFCSEFGGIHWPTDQAGLPDTGSWGYGSTPASEEAWYERFAGLVGALIDDPLMFGYCYTQLTDVFQEQNGIYRFDRTEKLDVARIRKIQTRTAAYELDQP